MHLESVEEAPATKWRWRGKTSGLRLVSQSGVLDTMDSCAAADVFFSEILLASWIQRVFRPGQSIFWKFRKLMLFRVSGNCARAARKAGGRSTCAGASKMGLLARNSRKVSLRLVPRMKLGLTAR